MTAMFVDLVESTQWLDRHGPEELMDGMAAYQTAIREVINRHGGYLLHHLGDGVVVCFGYPVASEHSPERAVEAGLSIVSDVDNLNGRVDLPDGVRLRVRVGIATGLIVAQPNAATNRFEDNFTGAALNIAARLQTLAKPGQVIIAQSRERELSWRSPIRRPVNSARLPF
jgi:class 3 adenylate cyclase